jgi:hypothetical protein
MDSEAIDPRTARLTNERMRRTRVFDPIEIKLALIQVETLPDDEGENLVDQLVVASGTAAAAKPSKKSDHLADMEFVLEVALKNRATRTQWMVAMQQYGKG